jgi:hypothetical protein
MIIDDTHRLVFVHIPKCAGTSVKRALRPLDSMAGTFEGLDHHPSLGHFHRAHIPLPDLAAHFPDAFAKVQAYTSFAILRDPLARFQSAIFQRLREYRGVAQSDFTPAMIAAEAAVVRGAVLASPQRLEAEWVHFTRQADFVELEGRRVVQHLFTVADMPVVSGFVEARTGIIVDDEKRNRTTVVSIGALKPIQRALREPYSRALSPQRRKAVREWMTRLGFYKDLPKQRFALPPDVETFVREHYARDYTILAKLQEDRDSRVAA